MIEIWKDSDDKEKTINFLNEKGFNLVEIDNTENDYLFVKK